MHNKGRVSNVMFDMSLRPQGAALGILLMLLFLLFVLLFLTLTVQPAQAQTFKVTYNFTGRQDGGTPVAGLTSDAAGNLYGGALYGGYWGGNCSNDGCGTVFKLSPKGSGWNITTLYTFTGESDGGYPYGRVIVGPDGSRYGMVGNGIVFNVRPASTACKSAPCPWTETVLYVTGDGADESKGDLTFDRAGNIYGTSPQQENVYELTHSDGGWAYSTLYSFTGGNDGYWPFDGVIFDQAGNLYGTTYQGGTYNWGTVFQLTPSANGWTEKVLYSFQGGNDGGLPLAGLVMDKSGNLYGATTSGSATGGTIFELTPSNGHWTFTVLHGFTGGYWSGPEAALVLDATGNLYGTKACYLNGCGDSYGYGAAFKLTAGNGGWSYTSLHDFTGGSDGGDPRGGVILDRNGNVYGTASAGGSYGYGVVWEITP